MHIAAKSFRVNFYMTAFYLLFCATALRSTKRVDQRGRCHLVLKICMHHKYLRILHINVDNNNITLPICQSQVFEQIGQRLIDGHGVSRSISKDVGRAGAFTGIRKIKSFCLIFNF